MPVSASAPTTHLTHVIEKTALKVLLTDVVLLSQVLSLAKGSSLKKLVVFGQASAKDKQQAQDIGIELLSFEELETKGKTANFEAVAVGNLKQMRKKELQGRCLIDLISSQRYRQYLFHLTKCRFGHITWLLKSADQSNVCRNPRMALY